MKTVITIWTILIGSIGFSQTDLIKEKLSYHSFSITPIEIFFSSYADGIAISADLSFAVYNNIFSLSGTIGEEQVLLGKVDKFKELKILYGRDFKLIDWLFIETYVGIGQVFGHDTCGVRNTKTVIPLITMVKVHASKSVSLALRLQAISNTINDGYSAGILLKWENI